MRRPEDEPPTGAELIVVAAFCLAFAILAILVATVGGVHLP